MSIGPFWTGDQPATPIEILLESDEDLDGYSTARVVVWDPDTGYNVAAAAAPIVDGTVTFDLTTTPFTFAGIYTIVLTLVGTAGRITLPAQRFVVQEVDGWHDLDSIRGVWTGAPNDDAALTELLQIARGQVLDYAPAGDISARQLVDYRRAQYMQARNLWNAAVKDAGGDFGAEGFAVTVFPLDWTVKNLIRPKRGVPIVG